MALEHHLKQSSNKRALFFFSQRILFSFMEDLKRLAYHQQAQCYVSSPLPPMWSLNACHEKVITFFDYWYQM